MNYYDKKLDNQITSKIYFINFNRNSLNILIITKMKIFKPIDF